MPVTRNLTYQNQIINEIRNGDNNKFAHLYKEMCDAFVIWMYQKYQCKEEEALDIYHECFLIFYRNILEGKLINLTSSLKTYIYSIAKHLWIDKLKKKQLGKSYKNAVINNSQTTTPHNAQLDLESAEILMVVKEYVSNLKEPCKSILFASLILEKSTEELQKQLNYKSKHVLYTQKNRCLKKLQSLINQKFTRDDF